MHQAVVLNNVDGLTFLVADLIAWHGGIWLLMYRCWSYFFWWGEMGIQKNSTFSPSHPCIAGSIPTPKCCHLVIENLPKTMTSCQLWVSWNTWQIMWGIVAGGCFLATTSIQISTLVGRWKIMKNHEQMAFDCISVMGILTISSTPPKNK